MRKLKNLAYAVILITVTLFACDDELSPDKSIQGSVQLGISTPNNQRGGANSENNMALARTIVLTLIDQEGSPIYNQKHLSLINHNGALMAEPITLNPGNYQLTEFLVLDEKGNVIYATPIKGSDLDHLVSKPLPIDISISPNEITRVIPEVIEIKDFTLDDLGYASFQFSVVEYFTFRVTAFVYDESTEEVELSTAGIAVYEAGTNNKLYEGELIDKTNRVAIVDGYDYELIFEKEGYQTLKLNFSNQELKSYSIEELKVILYKKEEEGLPSTNFVESGQIFNSSGIDVVSGDLDNDGDLDLFMTRSNGSASEVWINDGAGNFLNSGQLIGNSNASYVALGDLDGDGDLDAFITNADNQPNTVWWNDGAAHFTNSGQVLGNHSSFFADLGDLDGDGDLDVVVGNAAGQPNNVWINNGSGNFSRSQDLGTTEAHSLDLGDVDGDGDLDIFVASLDQCDQLWFNDGNGSFTMSGQSLGNGRSVKIALVDLDGDDDLDAFVAYYRFNSAQQLNKVLLNDGAGNFSDSGQELVSHNVNGLAMVDFDLDGDLDALTVSYYSEPYKLWINDGNATFIESDLPLGNHSSTGLTVGDFDSDGDQDFFVMHVASPHILWLGEQN